MGITMKDNGLQCSIFDGVLPLKITKPLRLIELFAGIGAQAKALENLGVQFEHYRICEFDKYAVASYNAVHGTEFTTSDITKIHAEDLGIVGTDKYEYIMTYSFPCTDLSKAGKQQGMSRESGTRSGLLWEVERLLKETKQLPQILLMENVPDVLSKKNCKDFYSWCDFLEKLGYTSKYAILNSKDYGVLQNRERCFMLSWLGEDYYYYFPDKIPLSIRLKDVLEKKVDEKYYISKKSALKFFNGAGNEQISKTVRTSGEIDGIVGTLTTDGSSPKHNNRVVEPIVWDGFNQSIRKDSSCVGTLTRNCGADLKRNGQGIIETTKQYSRPHGFNKGGVSESEVFPAVRRSSTEDGNNGVMDGIRVRKLTPKECWRLMGFDDESFSRAKKKVSNSQLYKQAGNSIVVDVLMAIFKKLF